MACPNGIEPMQLPIMNVTVTQDGRTNSRGIELIVGNPEQIVAISPSFSDQDVFVKNAAVCNGTSDNMCIGNNGGVYDSQTSDNFSRSSVARWNGTTTSEEVS